MARTWQTLESLVHPPESTGERATELHVWMRRLFGDPIPSAEMAGFFERLGPFLRYGKGLPDALMMAAKPGDPELRRIIESTIGPVSAGVPLHQALKRHEKGLPEIVIPVLEVGHAAGTMESSANRLERAFKGIADIDRQFKYAVFNPGLIFGVLGLYLIFHSLGADPMDALRFGAGALVRMGVLYVGIRLLWKTVIRWQPLRLAIDTVLLAIPDVGAVVRNRASARWGRSFSTLWHAGVPISESLEISSRSALNAHYERALIKAARHTRNGMGLGEALENTELLPAYLVDILKTGEATGNFGSILDRFVMILESEALARGSRQMMIGVVIVSLLMTLILVTAAIR